MQRCGDGMKELVRLLKVVKVRVVLLTPGMVDHTQNKDLKALNYSGKSIRILADFVLELVRRGKAETDVEEGVPCAKL